MLRVAEIIRNTFGKLFKVDGVPVYIDVFNYDIVGNENEVLQVVMDLTYCETVGVIKEDTDIMGSLSYKQRNEV